MFFFLSSINMNTENNRVHIWSPGCVALNKMREQHRLFKTCLEPTTCLSSGERLSMVSVSLGRGLSRARQAPQLPVYRQVRRADLDARLRPGPTASGVSGHDLWEQGWVGGVGGIHRLSGLFTEVNIHAVVAWCVLPWWR